VSGEPIDTVSGEPRDPPQRRGEEALEALAARSRQGARDRLRRLRLTAVPILQCAVGAALAWWVATGPLIGHEQPFFAPIAALISLGVGLGQRLPRVVELVVGVAVGVLVGDLRSLAVDVLRATGLEREQALGLLPSLPPGPVSYG
jgi:hypothetical protein